jgi:hypothetical protein
VGIIEPRGTGGRRCGRASGGIRTASDVTCSAPSSPAGASASLTNRAPAIRSARRKCLFPLLPLRRPRVRVPSRPAPDISQSPIQVYVNRYEWLAPAGPAGAAHPQLFELVLRDEHACTASATANSASASSAPPAPIGSRVSASRASSRECTSAGSSPRFLGPGAGESPSSATP